MVKWISGPNNPTVGCFIDLSFEVSEHILQLLASKGLIRLELALWLDEPKPLISEWLGGDYNLTLADLSWLKMALGERLIEVPGLQAK